MMKRHQKVNREGHPGMIKQSLAVAVTSVMLLGACEGMQDRPGETLGTIVGAGVGLIIGSKVGDGRGQSVATAIGAMAGAWIGSQMGKELDERDRQQAEQVAQDSLENNSSGVSSTWNNPDSGNSGSITPTDTYQTAEGEDCRDFESTITVDGETEVAQGRACRQADGSWLIVQ